MRDSRARTGTRANQLDSLNRSTQRFISVNIFVEGLDRPESRMELLRKKVSLAFYHQKLNSFCFFKASLKIGTRTTACKFGG